MNVMITPGKLHGCVTPPVSKSHMQRMLMAAALSERVTRLLCPDDNADIAAMARCLKALGAQITQDETGYLVQAPVFQKLGSRTALDCGESGAALRFLLPLCTALKGDITLVGRPSLARRPVAPLLNALIENGAAIEGRALPFHVTGGLHSGVFSLPGYESSQYFSGLLFALPLLCGDSRILFSPPLASRPYIDLTLQVIRSFGITAEPMENGWHIPGGQKYRSPGLLEAEKDASAAAVFLGARALGNDVTVLGMKSDSLQADRAMAQCLRRIGGQIDLMDCPDLAPILAVCAAVDERETCFTSVSRLRLKESDRVETIGQMVKTLGGHFRAEGDRMVIRGGALKGGVVDSRGDHRIVFSAAVAATACTQRVKILHAECVCKSYPRFFEDFERLGGRVRYE